MTIRGVKPVSGGLLPPGPSFINHILNKIAEVVRVYLPPDTNTLLSTLHNWLRSRDYVNLIIAGKAPALTYLSIDDAVLHWGVLRILDRDSRLRGSAHGRAASTVQPAVQG